MQNMTAKDIRDARYGEIFIIKETGLDVYSTAGLNDCPAELWDARDLEAIKKEFGAMQVQKKGPHFWMMDEQALMMGEKVSFQGREARWAAHAPISVVQKGATGGTPCAVYTPSKTQSMVYSKGKPVFELVDPEGNVYVLQAHDEQFTTESLAGLGDKLNVPECWQYRTRTLTEDLNSPAEMIYAVGDDFHQYNTRI